MVYMPELIASITESPFEIVELHNDRHNYYLWARESYRRWMEHKDMVVARAGEELWRTFRIMHAGTANVMGNPECGVGAYRIVLAGIDSSIPRELRLPPRFRIAATRATDGQIVDAVARLVAAYVESLVFAEDDTGAFAGSPYDQFLLKNGLPRTPRPFFLPASVTAWTTPPAWTKRSLLLPSPSTNVMSGRLSEPIQSDCGSMWMGGGEPKRATSVAESSVPFALW